METGKELTGIDEKPDQHAHDSPLSVHFLAADEIASQELDLVMVVLDEIVAEMRRLGVGATQGADPGCGHLLIQGEKSC